VAHERIDEEDQMRTLTRALTVAALLAPVCSAAAQSFSDAVAYTALITTPTAGVAPSAKQWMLSEPRTGIGADLQWGHVAEEGVSINTLTGGVTIPIAAGHGDVGISAGYLRPSCDVGSCDGNFVAGGVVEGRLLQSQMQTATFTIGLSGRVGFAKPSGGTIWSAAAGVPVSLALGNRKGLQVVPFITPSYGWGRASGGGDSESGSRFMLGGGIGLLSSSSGLGFNVGVQKVFISGGKPMFGAGFSWSGL
jgi:hypothetical protein